jgi:hypothetical protein
MQMIGHNGRTQSTAGWARELGISIPLLQWRLRHWPTERALSAPKQPHSKLLTFRGRTQNITAWAASLDITPRTLRDRLLRGEPVELALSYRWREKVK